MRNCKRNKKYKSEPQSRKLAQQNFEIRGYWAEKGEWRERMERERDREWGS